MDTTKSHQYVLNSTYSIENVGFVSVLKINLVSKHYPLAEGWIDEDLKKKRRIAVRKKSVTRKCGYAIR